MGTFHDFFQNFRPFLARRGTREAENAAVAQVTSQDPHAELAKIRERSLTLARFPAAATEWVPIEDTLGVRQAFMDLRTLIFEANSRVEARRGSPRRWQWEAGQLTGERRYFYLKPWDKMGLLFEETPKGWLISRADKIVSEGRFVRERTPWDQVTLYHDSRGQGLLRVRSTLLGEDFVSLPIYDDFIVRTLRKDL